MKSGGKLDIRAPQKRSNPRNSFVPSEQSYHNSFAEQNPSELQSEQSIVQLNRSSAQHPSVRKESPLRKDQQQSNRSRLPEKNSSSITRKRQVVKQESLNLNNGKQQKYRQKNVPRQQSSSIIQDTFNQRQNNTLHIREQPQQEQEQEPEISQFQKKDEEEKMYELNANMSKLSQSLMDLRDNYHELERQEKSVLIQNNHQGVDYINRRRNQRSKMFGVMHSPQKQKQIGDYLEAKQKQKIARQKVMEQLVERNKKRIEQQIDQQKKLIALEKHAKLMEIKSYSKFDQKHKQMKIIEEQRKKMVNQYVQKFKGKQLKYQQKIMKEEQLKQQKKLEKQKQILTERKQMLKPLNFEDIQQHQQWFHAKLQELDNQKRMKKQEKLEIIQEENMKLQDLWRGKPHQITQQQRQQLKRKKKQPKLKAAKIRQYRDYVKEKFKPKTYQSKSHEKQRKIDQSRHSFREVKRYRYYKGVSYGQIVQTTPIPKNNQEKKRMGDQYMQFMKHLPKKKCPSPEEIREAEYVKLLQQKYNASSVGKVPRHQEPANEEERKKRLQIELSESVNRDQLKMIMLQLKANDQKLTKKQKALKYLPQGNIESLLPGQRQINQGLVDNIERKLSLLTQLEVKL